MKKLLLLPLFALAMNSFSQKKNPLSLDSTARKHELQVNVGILASIAFADLNSPVFGADLVYARSFHGAHYVRAGIGFRKFSHSNRENLAPYFPIADSVSIYNFNQSKSSSTVWGKVGYEISIGSRKTRFLFGADILLGYVTQNTHMSYNIDSTWGETKITQENYRGIYLGINPRFTVRHNFSPLFSGGLTVGYMLGTNYYLSKRQISDLSGNFTFNPDKSISGLIGAFRPEINLIFKIPEKKK